MSAAPAGFTAPPAHLVDDHRPNLGRFSGPLGRTNLIDAHYRGLPRPLRWLRLKEWQAVQVVTPRLFINVALFDVKLLGLVQVKIYDRERGVKHLFEHKLRPGRLRLDDQLLDGRNRYHDGTTTVEFTNRLARGAVDVALTVANPRIAGRFTLDAAQAATQAVSLPFAHGSMYSHKGMFAVTGELELDGERHDLDGALALLDDHKGYYPYVMRWDWVTSAHRGPDGVARGFNLTHNQCVDPEVWNENCAWVDGAIGRLPAVEFARTAVGTADEQWRIRDRQGLVDLRFTPTVPGDLAMNVGLLESRYRGPFGTCHGHLAPLGLPPIAVDAWFGMGEQFWLRC